MKLLITFIFLSSLGHAQSEQSKDLRSFDGAPTDLATEANPNYLLHCEGVGTWTEGEDVSISRDSVLDRIRALNISTETEKTKQTN